MIRSLVLALALLSFAAGAQTPATMNVGLSWTPPTQRTDGTPLAPADITGYRILCGPTSNPSPYPIIHNVGPVTAFSKEEFVAVMGLAQGTAYYCALRTLALCNGSACTSSRSNEVSFVIPVEPPPQQLPRPPEPLVVPGGATQFAYVISQAGGRLALVPVGTIPAGTPCDASQGIRDSNGLTAFLVPEEAVAWSGTVRRSVVFSPCAN